MSFSRRSLLRGAVALGAAASLPARAQVTPRRKALAVVFFSGGFNALHVTPRSLGGAFGTTPESMVPTGTGLFVDKQSFGAIPQAALQRMAVVGVQHGITAHDPARSAIFTGAASYPLTLAAAMQSQAAMKCALLGPGNISAAAVPGASLTKVSDVRPALDVMVGSARPGEPGRELMAKSLELSWRLSRPLIERNPRTLAGHTTGFDGIIGALHQPVRPLDWSGIATAYGVDATKTTVDTNAARFAAAELVIQGGTNVAIVAPSPDAGCGEAGWDTHGDGGSCARAMFERMVTASLSKFLERTLTLPDVDVTTLIIGEFGRDPELSDHAGCLAAAVFGPGVRPGSTGAAFSGARGKLTMPPGTPGIGGMWALAAELAGVTSRPFGANPHAALVTAG
jgi:hypothetical protein